MPDIERRLRALLLIAATVVLIGCGSVLDGTGVGGGTGTEPGGGSGSISGGGPAPGGGSAPGGAVGPGASALDQPAGTLVFPKAGVRDPHPIVVQALTRQPGDAHLVLRLDWVSGVEPCSVLAGVTVDRTGDTFALTVMEGSLGQQVACPEIAMYKATLVDLGALDPGTYTVVADPGLAPPLTVTLP